MLAYVFWHWKQDRIEVNRYEMLLQNFHTSLTQKQPEGFIHSIAFAIEGAPWAANGQSSYEDWYIVNGSAALDPLNSAATTAPHQEPHDLVAGAVVGGTAGLYRICMGTPLATRARFATWLGKPDGMKYQELYSLLEPLTKGGKAALWGRQMVLGPTPEFCLHTTERPDMPSVLYGLTLQLRPVWS